MTGPNDITGETLTGLALALVARWDKMDPKTRDPDYEKYVYQLARDYALELWATDAVTAEEINAAVAEGRAADVLYAYDLIHANTVAVAEGRQPTKITLRAPANVNNESAATPDPTETSPGEKLAARVRALRESENLGAGAEQKVNAMLAEYAQK